MAFTAIALLSALPGMHGQTAVSIDESGVRAVLRNQATAVLLPIANLADHPVKAQLTLAWLAADDSESSRVQQDIVIAQGPSSTVEICKRTRPTMAGEPPGASKPPVWW